MDLPKGQDTSQYLNWRTHIKQAEEFDGSDADYCIKHGLKKSRFVYYKGKYGGKSKFTEVITTAAKKVHGPCYPQQLPDPKWLSEVIHNLMKF